VNVVERPAVNDHFEEIALGYVSVGEEDPLAATILVDDFESPVNLGGARRLERRDDTLHGRGTQPIVGVQETNDLAGAGGETCVERRSLAPVLLENLDDPTGVTVDDGAGLIRRAVVDDDDLAVRVGLAERAVDRLAHIAGVVEVVDDDAHERSGGHIVNPMVEVVGS
jgi:hypothetical protein